MIELVIALIAAAAGGAAALWRVKPKEASMLSAVQRLVQGGGPGPWEPRP